MIPSRAARLVPTNNATGVARPNAHGQAITKTETESREWFLGEDYGFTMADLMIGAYYALSELHGGQYSDTYAALCALGAMYQPNAYGSSYERDTGEETVYEAISYHLFDPINDKMI